jgi:hypothetical protein
VIHGESDNVVPKRSTKEFARSLRSAGINVVVKYLKGASHTDPIIEDLLFDESGGTEAGAITELLRLIPSHKSSTTTNMKTTSAVSAVSAVSSVSAVSAARSPAAKMKAKRLRRPSMLSDGFGFVTDERGKLPENTWCSCVPRTVIKLARWVNPF